jgi:hypothetical protein
MLLVASFYANDLSKCLVYFNKAHTRGINLKMLIYACGALTLSLKQIKDYIV